MKPAAQTTFAERVGRTFGGLWRGCVRLDRRATHLLVEKGWAPGVAQAVMLFIKLAAIGVLLYAAFWLTLLFVFVIATAWLASSSDEDVLEQSQGAGDEEHDHRKSVFYHPLSYSDDPDPRFEDD